jgi:hypothetical protein
MLRLYRSLLFLYPVAYRDEFGPEMTAVFLQAEEEHDGRSLAARALFYGRESGGLILGAAQSHFRSVFGNNLTPFWRFSMQRQFRFPRSTVFLMCVILAAVAFAIDKAQRAQAAISGRVVPTSETVTPLILTFVIVYLVAALAWGILYAFRQTGMHRLDKV